MAEITSAVICLGHSKKSNKIFASPTKFIAYVERKIDLSSCLKSIPSASLQTIEIKISFEALVKLFDPLAIAAISQCLRPKGSSIIFTVFPDSDSSVDLSPVQTSLLLAGLKAVSEEKKDDGTRIVIACKKSPTSFQAPSKVRIAKISQRASPLEESKISIHTKVNLSAFDLNEYDDDDVVDEDGLLNFSGDNDFLAPPPMSQNRKTNNDDCAGRKPCDDCTCGRADALKGGESESKQAPSSSCGNCGKGDAFRCAGCPYLGKPAFREGEEHLVLNLMDDL